MGTIVPVLTVSAGVTRYIRRHEGRWTAKMTDAELRTLKVGDRVVEWFNPLLEPIQSDYGTVVKDAYKFKRTWWVDVVWDGYPPTEIHGAEGLHRAKKGK